MIELTPSQKTAVEINGAGLLVSAAAGAGKTMVMTERIAGRVAGGVTDIGDILVMTFTDAAAANMKERVSERFAQMLYEAKTDREKAHIARCIRKLQQASISTIHSFCLDIIRNFYYEARTESDEAIIEPGFRIEESGEAETLLSMSIEEIFAERYEFCDTEPENENAADFIRLVESYGGERNDGPLREMVGDLIHFLRSMPDYNEWMDSGLEMLKTASLDFDSSEYYRIIMKALKLRLDNARKGLPELEAFLDSGPKLKKNSKDNDADVVSWRDFVSYVRLLLSICDSPVTVWDDIYDVFRRAPEPYSFRGNGENKEELKDIYGRYFAELIFMGTGKPAKATYKEYFFFDTEHVFVSDKETIQKDIRYMYPVVRAFFSLASDVISRYSEMKRELNMIDFSDFEHIALMLLRKPEIRDYYTGRYKEIYIDEYQDTSGIQEAVISLISGGSVFMVGDVKQSIYRFRHARPEIFLEKMARAVKDSDIGAEDAEMKLVELNENFRSLGGVISAANSVFLQLMSQDAGEINYSDGHELVPGREGAECISQKVQVLLTDISEHHPDEEVEAEQEEGAGEGNYEKEACAVALETAKLLNKGEKPGDIAILARTGNICNIFAGTLEKAGIPVIIEKGDPSPDVYELKVLESLLNVLDNPGQDIHLAAVMRSPLFGNGFDTDELLAIRSGCSGKNTFFHECVDEYLISGTDDKLKAKITDFKVEIGRLREMSISFSPGDIFDHVLRDSGLGAYISAMPDGKRRMSHLRRFAEWIRSFTQARHCGLHEAAIHLKELKDKGVRELPFAVEENTEDRVRIMTIHKSKGLQYKIVFLVGTSGKFRSTGTKSGLIYSGVSLPGIWMIDPQRRFKYPTPTVFAAAEMISGKDIAEEMRLMYVAMTRAKDRLLISGIFDSQKTYEGKDLSLTAAKVSSGRAGKVIAPHIVLSARRMLDWLIMSLACNPHVDMRFAGIVSDRATGKTEADERFYPDCWDIRFFKGTDASKTLNEAMELTLSVRPEMAGKDKEDSGSLYITEENAEIRSKEAYKEKLRRKFFGSYRYYEAAKTPLKLSVSDLKRKWISEEESTQGINLTVRALDTSEISSLSGAERGTAVHSFIRYSEIAALTGDCNEEKILTQLDAMEREKMFSSAESDHLRSQAAHLSTYFNSPLAASIATVYRENRERIFREVPFTLTLPCGNKDQASGFAPGDFQLVQGMIDCWFIKDGKAVIVDYKTDFIPGDEDDILSVLRQKYEVQLRMYSDAVARIRGLEVEKAVIWLFSVDKEFKIC